MITKEELHQLLISTETYRVERTISTSNMDKFCEAICAFSNDMPNSRQNGYLIIGANDDGSLSGLSVDDALLKKIAAIRSDGNILPLPVMNVERFDFAEGDLLVAEVQPSFFTPVRYRGRSFIRIGPRKDIASEVEERILSERRMAKMATFDTTPCLQASINDIYVDKIKSDYLLRAIDPDILENDKRDVKEQMASLRLYDLEHDCPTFAAIILFGKNPKYFLPGYYIQFVRFRGLDKAGDIEEERTFEKCLFDMLPQLDAFLDYSIVKKRPVSVSILREKQISNYPYLAIRELLMNAVMHRDFQANMPIRFYQFDNRIEMMNPGGLYGNARPENFPNVNDYRNPIISEAMKVMGYVNKFNRGIDRVQTMLKENGTPLAIFDVDKLTVFEVTVGESRDENLLIDLQIEDSKGTKIGTKIGHQIGTKIEEVKNMILEFCIEPKSLLEIATYLGYTNRTKLKKNYIDPLLGDSLEMTIPDKPNNKLQRYVTVKKDSL